MDQYDIPDSDVKFMLDYRYDYDFHNSIDKDWGLPAFPPTGDKFYSLSPKTQHLISKSYKMNNRTPLRCDRKKLLSKNVFETVKDVKNANIKAGCCSPYPHGDMGYEISNDENELCGYAFEGEPVVNTNKISKKPFDGSIPKLIDINKAQIFLKNKGLKDINSLIDISKYLKITNQMSLELKELENTNIELKQKIDDLNSSNEHLLLENIKRQQQLCENYIIEMRMSIYKTAIEFIFRQQYSPEISIIIQIVLENDTIHKYKDEFLEEWSKLYDTDYYRFKKFNKLEPKLFIKKDNEEHQYFGKRKSKKKNRKYM